MKNKSSAFSMIELSVVIVIVGLIIAMIVKSSKSAKTSLITNAASITRGSPVANIDGLSLWLEPTLEESFNYKESDNNATVSVWKDVNPAVGIKSDAVNYTNSSKPIYIANGIAGLPSLQFDGVNDLLTVGMPYSNRVASNNFQIFIVAKTSATITILTEIDSGINAVSGQKYLIGPAHGGGNCASNPAAGAGISMGNNGITVAEHSGCYIPPIAVYSGTINNAAIISLKYENRVPKIYLNGTLVRTGLASTINSVFPGNTIGGYAYGYFQGLISEVIVYDSDLSDDDRKEVELYLSKKYKIKLS